MFCKINIERDIACLKLLIYFRFILSVIFMLLMNILCTRLKKNDNVGGFMLLIDVVMCMGQD